MFQDSQAAHFTHNGYEFTCFIMSLQHTDMHTRLENHQ